ncbi:MAG: ATP-binding protein, partial [Clostridia bacterium]|nr:ATP-binding protein [Clostridia bacterium]
MAQLLGNRRLLEQLNTAVAENRVAHAYLLCGGPGSGKKTLADIMCRKILCSAGGCGRCAVCEKLEKRVHPDVTYLTGATKIGNYTV